MPRAWDEHAAQFEGASGAEAPCEAASPCQLPVPSDSSSEGGDAGGRERVDAAAGAGAAGAPRGGQSQR